MMNGQVEGEGDAGLSTHDIARFEGVSLLSCVFP